MRGPPGSLARSGLFRGPVASRSPCGRCKGFRVSGPDRELRVQRVIPADREPSRCLPSWPSGEAPQTTRFLVKIPAHPKTLGAVACLQCLPPREGPELQVARPDMPGLSSASDAGRNKQSVPGRSLQRIGKSREKPGRARTFVATGLIDPEEGFCRSYGTRSLCEENTMNSVSTVLPPSFTVSQVSAKSADTKHLWPCPARRARRV